MPWELAAVKGMDFLPYSIHDFVADVGGIPPRDIFYSMEINHYEVWPKISLGNFC